MCTSLSMVGRQRWKREGERWGWLNGSGSSGGSGDKGGRAGGTHGGSDGASIAPREIMNENTTACYLAATEYGFLPLSLSLSLGYRPTTSLSSAEPPPRAPSFVRAPEKAIRSYALLSIVVWPTVVRNEGHE